MNHHYYASTATNWVVGPTRVEAIKKALANTKADGYKLGDGEQGGTYVWTCRVDLPMSATYTIENYRPMWITKPGADGELESTGELVPMSEFQSGDYKTARGKVLRLSLVND